MKVAFAIAVPLGVFLTLVAWRLSQLLSSDAIAMAVGLLLGALSLVPATVLVLAAGRRDAQDDDDDLRYSRLANTDRVRLSGPGVQSGVYRLETPDAPRLQVIDCEPTWRQLNES